MRGPPITNIDLGQNWLRKWLVAWWHQAINWTNADFSLVRFCGTYLRVITANAQDITMYNDIERLIRLKSFLTTPRAQRVTVSLHGISSSSSLWLVGSILSDYHFTCGHDHEKVYVQIRTFLTHTQLKSLTLSATIQKGLTWEFLLMRPVSDGQHSPWLPLHLPTHNWN